MLKPADEHSDLSFLLRSAIAGGIAGGVAKTSVTPLDRIKILFQTHNADFQRFSGPWRGIGDAIQFIIRNQGVRGLFQGNTLTLARAIPHAAVGYTVYDKANQFLMPAPDSQTSFRRLLAGAITGLSAMPFTYPFEVIRVRMAIETKNYTQRSSPWSAIRTIWSEGRSNGRITPLPILNFYRGFTVSALGVVPYRGGVFLIWESLNAYSRKTLRPETLRTHKTRIHLAVGAIAGTVFQIATYPLEIIRRTQQANGEPKMIGIRETVSQIWTRGGWRGFYVGLGVGLIKQVPMYSVSLTVWQIAKGFLDI
ncbi:putative LEU5-mitochondrial coenzyme A transporter-member of the mitochondrial carrier family [Gymnopilus junonius]|uniref:LEU5-mitochondrial coenzyme A transporter-member of the mitochondrial carrier family n=1 Tax=Gymnopilus junonius TaxID=109634 RepID=A0A9P5NMF2_GYMJU|nr:putative LEU5-mitochondrial coenzyme A transporter-member of the mitochondrial carrier family [Gymnopilus junonius]